MKRCSIVNSLTHFASIGRACRGRAACLAFALGLLAPTPQASAGFPAFKPELASLSASPGSGAVQSTTPGSDAVPRISAYPLSRGAGIRVDGRLDDDAWFATEPGNGFRVWDPERGAPASENTLFRIAYDDEALYFGVACFERDAQNIRSKLSRRDRLGDTDAVSLYLDPYHDRGTGYMFEVNPQGVQRDSYLYNDGNQDDAWDAVWQAETFRDDEGWYAEVRIPFELHPLPGGRARLGIAGAAADAGARRTTGLGRVGPGHTGLCQPLRQSLGYQRHSRPEAARASPLRPLPRHRPFGPGAGKGGRFPEHGPGPQVRRDLGSDTEHDRAARLRAGGVRSGRPQSLAV